jgi:uncharacterized repeat protein (TIGR01451 family)
MSKLSLPLFLALVFSMPVLGQNPFSFQPYPTFVPSPPPPPLLFVRFDGPAGMKVTFFRGTAGGQTVTVPFTVGFRPGYILPMRLSEVPGHPGATFSPTVEIYGSLLLANRLRNPEFPAGLVFRDEDFNSVQAGAMVTKVVVLERPDTAIPQASKANEPLQIDVAPGQDPFAEGRQHGQPLMALRMGQREVTTKELAAQGMSGTVLMPGERVLPLPRVPPWVPWHCYPVYDPILGPPDPSHHIAICDGGDCGMPAGLDREGRIRGLDPSDTMARYTDHMGQKQLSISNRVCLCVPRFVVVRGEIVPAGQLAFLNLDVNRSITGGQQIEVRVPALEYDQNQHPGGLISRLRTSSAFVIEGTAITGRVEGLSLVSSRIGTGEVEAGPAPKAKEPAGKPLKIIKFPDKCGGLVGDIITFTIRFSNEGGQPINDIVLVDNLTGRFEYIPGSAKTDREAVFTTQPNDAGSTLLRWEFQDTLHPGQSGQITFQVRIR